MMAKYFRALKACAHSASIGSKCGEGGMATAAPFAPFMPCC